MGIREKLSEGNIGIKVAAVVLVLGVGAVAFQMTGGRQDGAAPAATRAFYTDDNGKTFFKDDINKLVPFDHAGKPAYRADVFQGADGKQFVGLIYRFTDPGRREMETYLNRKAPDPGGLGRMSIEQRGMQVKRPASADRDWTIADDAVTQRLQGSVRDATGKPATLVTP